MNNYSAALSSFLVKYEFDQINLNAINHNGVTPLTAAIENNHNYIVDDLLAMKVNPLIENIHGNTPLNLCLSRSCFYRQIEQAISDYNCGSLNCTLGSNIVYLNRSYRITKIIQGGACSLAAMEIQDCSNSQVYFAKIKKDFGGFEIRNYMSLNQYIDLFKIDKLIIPHKILPDTITNKSYCLIQKYVHGMVLSETFKILKTNDEKNLVGKAAIQALCKLHLQGYVHNDALPDNCLWDPISKMATFIDYDVMRKFSDYAIEDNEYITTKRIADLARLILGIKDSSSKKNVLGLIDYIDNVADLLEDRDELEFSIHIKNSLLELISQYSLNLKKTGIKLNLKMLG